MSVSGEWDDELSMYPLPMQPELREAITTLSRKLQELHIIWQQYRQLYGEESSAIDVLNRTAGLFFKIVQDELWDSVLLGICRMTDLAEHPKWNGRKNLTIWSLPPLIADEELRGKLETLCKDAVKAAEPAREHRHKRIAHQDHGYTVDRKANPLSGVSRALVEDMLKTLRDVMKLVEGHYNGHDVLYEKFVDASGARVLVSKLRRLEHLISSQD